MDAHWLEDVLETIDRRQAAQRREFVLTLIACVVLLAVIVASAVGAG